jgi:hypothetical protein
MPDKKKKPASIEARMQKVGDKLEFKTDTEIEAFEKQQQAGKMISGAVSEIKNHIGKQPIPPEQLLFSFMPTLMTRTTPFFPMNKQDMRDRSYNTLTWETSWGQITISGSRLSIYDESVLLSLLVLVKKYRSDTFETTQHELCRVAGIQPGKNTYQAIEDSIDRLIGTKIRLEAKAKGKRKTKPLMINTILSGWTANPKTGKYTVTINPYFLQMYLESFITNIDIKFRSGLKGDITKALYRFYESQRDDRYSCHVLTLARAVNLNIDLPIRKLRERIRKANRELRKQGYLLRSMLSKRDTVTVWKAKKQIKR